MEFFDWNMLSSCAGAAMAVGVLTQVTKGIPGIVKIPTQLWSYMLALITLLLAMTFDTGFSASGAGWSGLPLLARVRPAVCSRWR